MNTQDEISTMLPPPEDEVVYESVSNEVEEFEFLPLSDLTGIDGNQLIAEKQKEIETEIKEQVVEEVAEVPVTFDTRTKLTIEGIEATQAIQFYKSKRHLHVPHAEADNSVPLIERKHMAIRVYPDLKIPWYLSAGSGKVDGGVWFKRIDIQDTYKKAARLNGKVKGRPAITIDRGKSNHTLNFRISDLYTKGKLLVYSRVWTYSFGRRIYSPWLAKIYTFNKVPDVRIRAHGIKYKRGSVNKPAPTLSDFIATGVYLRKTYPMSRFNFVSYDEINFGGDLTNTTGNGCGVGWNSLWSQLRTLYYASGQDANHYGLMKAGIPTAYGGCGGGNVGASFVGQGSVMAQELGHAMTRKHAPGCNVGRPDANYPHYSHPSSATIGEYGMDYATGKVYDPSNSNDFMGYCSNPWVSPYTYRGLINDINSQPTPAPASDIDVHAVNLYHKQEHLYLNFKMSIDGNVDILSGFTQIGLPGRSLGKETPHTIEVQDKKGRVLWAKRLTLEEEHQDQDDSNTNFFEAIPMVEEARKLVIKCGHIDAPKVFDIPELPPTVKIKSVNIKKQIQSGKINLEWTSKSETGEKLSSMLFYTCDGGKYWKPIAIGLERSEFEADLDQLPGGNDCRFKVLVSTILRSASSETNSFQVETKARKAMISPIKNDSREIGTQFNIELAGCAHSPDGCAEEEELQWFSSLDGYLGSGSHLMANNLKAGEHVISLVAPDGKNGETRAEHIVRLLPLLDKVALKIALN